MRRLACLFALLVACTDEAAGPDEEWGLEGPVEPLPPPGKEDSQYRRGLLVATNTSRTQVWTARNRWEDTTTAAYFASQVRPLSAGHAMPAARAAAVQSSWRHEKIAGLFVGAGNGKVQRHDRQ